MNECLLPELSFMYNLTKGHGVDVFYADQFGITCYTS